MAIITGTAWIPGRDRGVFASRRRPFAEKGVAEAEQARNAESRELARACDGDTKAFDRLVDAYKQRIFTHVLRMVNHREDAEDLTQEAFMRAYRYLHLYDPSRPFRSWMYAIATNTALNGLRARGRRGIEASFDDEWRPSAAETPLNNPAPDPRQGAARSELADRLSEAVSALAPAHAALIHLHYTEGMSIREAAEVVGMSEGAAKTALCRARKQLRKRLIEDEQS
jgi:RNA polymerase sigma-70 factor (ECF subfamily)